MLSGPELGNALRIAIKLKGKTQTEVGDAFGVRQSSVAGWLRTGRIDKAHVSALLAYFSDVVGPEHWGLPASSPADAGAGGEVGTAWPFERISRAAWAKLTERQRGVIEDAAVKKLRELQAERGASGELNPLQSSDTPRRALA